MVCLVITEPYGYERLIQRAAEDAPSKEWLIIYFLRPSRLRDTVKELGDQGWLGPGSLRRLQDSLMEGYRALVDEVLQTAARHAQKAGARARTAVVEGELEALTQIIRRRCGRLYCDDMDLLGLLQSMEDK